MNALRRHLVLGLTLAIVTVGVVALLVRAEASGTGAQNVGDAGAPVAAPDDASRGGGDGDGRRVERRCEPTETNPGGDTAYIPNAPREPSLGEGFVITGLVRAADGCRPLPNVRVQVWLATEDGSEYDNRASVYTDADGRYRLDTAPVYPQYGEPNIHVAYDDQEYETVFVRSVTDLDDRRAVVNLTLRRG